MSEKIALISGADSAYFPLLYEWIHSIRRHEQSQNMDICILDAGLTADQRNILTPLVTIIQSAGWPDAIPDHKIKGREYYKACVNRPFLKDYFPGYDLYFWMDADTWVQDWKAVELFLKGARKGKIALTSQSDRAYPKGMRVKWLGSWPFKARSFYYSNALKAFDGQTARQIFPYHVVLAGAFCLHADAPHWEKWQELIIQALDKGKVFTAEQLTLGMMVYLEGLPAEILPAYLHWLCEFKPLWDPGQKLFVEPYLPHEPLGILHLSGFDKMRVDRSETTDFETTEGGKITYSYRYPYFNGETGEDVNDLHKAA